MEKVVAKTSEQSSGSARRDHKASERTSPAFDLTPGRGETWDRGNIQAQHDPARPALSGHFLHPVLRLQRSIGNSATGLLIQRQCATCASDEEETIQRKEQSPGGTLLHPLLQAISVRTVQAKSSAVAEASPAHQVVPASSHGRPLEHSTRSFMESRLNADFSRVRVHADAPAADAARNLNATAFTTGHDIYFASGKYAPAQPEGQRLLAHELAHTIQQSQGQGPSKLARKFEGVNVGHPDDPLEHQADLAADRAMMQGAATEPVEAPPDSSESVPAPAPLTDEPVLRYESDRTAEQKPEQKSESKDAKPDQKPWWKDLASRALSALAPGLAEFISSFKAKSASSSAPTDAAGSSGEAQAATAPAADKAKDKTGDKTKQPAKAGPAPEDALQPGDEGPPKIPKLDTAKVKQALAKKGAPAPKAQALAKPAPAGGAPATTVSAGPTEAAPATVEPAPGKQTSAAAPPTQQPQTRQEETAPKPQAVPGAEAATGPQAEAEMAGMPDVEEPTPEAAQGPQAPAGQAAPVLEEPAEASTSETPAAETPTETSEVPGADEAASKQEADAANAAQQAPSGAPPEVAGIEQMPPLDETSSAEASAPAAEPEPPEPAPKTPEATTESTTPSEEKAEADARTETSASTEPAQAIPEAETSELESHASAAESVQTSAAAQPESLGAETQPAAEPVATSDTGSLDTADAATAAPSADTSQGGCAPSADDSAKPSSEEGGADGPCGDGGGTEVPEQPAAPVPDVAQSDPSAAMGAIADLPPAQLQTALGGVQSAASKSVGDQKKELAANPPQMERPSGVPAQRDASIPVVPPGVPAPHDAKSVDRAPAGASIPVPQPAPLPAPPPQPIQSARTPKPIGDDTISREDAHKAAEAISDLPTTDPALDVTAGDPPKLGLAGDASPERADEQRAKLDQGTGTARSQGLEDVAQPMGENDIYPVVPKETLTAKPGDGASEQGAADKFASCVTGGDKAPADGAPKEGGGPESDPQTISIVAQEKKGDEIKGAVTKAQGDMVSKQQENAGKIADEKEKSQKDVDKLVEDNAAEQKEERTKARHDSLKTRTEWNKEQATLVDDSNKDAAKVTSDARATVAEQQKSADQEAAGHIQQGNKEAADARADAERKAAAEKKKSEEDSGGFLDWIGSKVSAFFDKIKSAIHAVFDAARKLVKAAIEKAKQLAVAVIEKARKLVVAAIHAAGDALIAIGDRVLAGFPKLRDKFRKAVQDRVKAAEKAVNKLADALKKGVQKLLDLLGAAIDAYLRLLECAYTAIVDAVASVVKGAIQFAKAVVQALAVFGVLIKDISAGPGQWLSNLGNAVMDGLKNCFWSKFKTAVKNWFNSKLEEVLGLPIMIFQLLFKGCLKMADIGKMAWEALKAAIPTVLIQLLIEKLVAMIVPAAGAILTIIEGLRAAWGTVSRIIAAFELFFAFLKAVRGGKAAGRFATALAAAAIVVIDFVANWLLQRLRKPAGAVAGRLRSIAQKIAAALKKGFAAVKKGARIALRAVKRGLQAAGRGLKKIGQAIAKTKAGKAVISAMKRAGHAIARSRGGKAVRRAIARVKSGVAKLKQKVKDWRDKRKKGTPEEKLERARVALQPKIANLFGKGVWKIRLRAQLAIWRVFYGLSQLRLRSSGGEQDVYAHGSGEGIFGHAPVFTFQTILRLAQDRRRDLGIKGEVTSGPYALERGRSPEELAEDLSHRANKPGDVPMTILGHDVEARQVFRGGHNIYLPNLGTYPEIGKEIAGLGMSNKDLGEAIAKGIKTGKGDPLVMNLIALHAVEGGRMRSARLTNLMSVVGLREQQLTLQDVFGASTAKPQDFKQKLAFGGPANPSSQIGARAAHERLELMHADPSRFAAGTDVAKRAEEQWNRHLVLIAKMCSEEVFRDEALLVKEIEKLIKAYDKIIGRRR